MGLFSFYYRGFMKKKVSYCIPTYKSYELAYEGVLAALRGSVSPDQIIIIDNSGDGAGTTHLMPLTHKFANVHIWPQLYNIGVAKSWNTFHDSIGDDYIIIANDDVQVETYTIERMITAAEENPNDILFCGDGSSGNAFSLFMLTFAGYNIIGRFDERFYPAYFEDNDYARRMLLKGYKIHFVSGATYLHVGSSTMKKYTQLEMDAHHHAFRANQAYYISKWGGLPGYEEFYTTFNI
jgi:GT2 family glycosyltransferase